MKSVRKQTIVVWRSRLVLCHANQAAKVETTSVKRSLAFLQFSTGGNVRPSRFVRNSYFLSNEMSIFFLYAKNCLRCYGKGLPPTLNSW